MRGQVLPDKGDPDLAADQRLRARVHHRVLLPLLRRLQARGGHRHQPARQRLFRRDRPHVYHPGREEVDESRGSFTDRVCPVPVVTETDLLLFSYPDLWILSPGFKVPHEISIATPELCRHRTQPSPEICCPNAVLTVLLSRSLAAATSRRPGWAGVSFVCSKSRETSESCRVAVPGAHVRDRDAKRKRRLNLSGMVGVTWNSIPQHWQGVPSLSHPNQLSMHAREQ
eukprot:2430630-Rhodomonas_salina.3